MVTARQSELLAPALVAAAAVTALLAPGEIAAVVVALAGIGAIVLTRRAAFAKRTAAADAMRETVTNMKWKYT